MNTCAAATHIIPQTFDQFFVDQLSQDQERVIGDISSKIGSLVNIENIVQTTIQELGDTLPGTDVAIQFTTGQSG